MAKYRNRILELSSTLLITDGGLETKLIFHDGIPLPDFAAFTLLKTETGRQWFREYFLIYIHLARKYNVGLILESPTWRASLDWFRKQGYADEDIVDINRKSIELLSDLRDQYETEQKPILIEGCLGPRGDGYNPSIIMSADEAQAYHAAQIEAFSQTNADLITALTISYPEEAIGVVRAAKAVQMPIAISFTVENDGKLPTGQTLKEAIELVDRETENSPMYYMVNCIRPGYLQTIFETQESWIKRIHGIKGNASKKSHAELDESQELDAGDPFDFAQSNQIYFNKYKHINIFGGCCGTDSRHIEETCKLISSKQ